MIRTAFCLLSVLSTALATAQTPDPRPVVINEILFNPKPAGSDYVELYNRSDSPIDISTLVLTNRTGSGAYGVLKKLWDTTRYLLPGAYVVFTEDAEALARQYFIKNPDAVLAVASLPSYPNTEGTVVLLDTAATRLDEVRYNEDWHVELIDDAEGVALERIDPDVALNDKEAWRSAASDAGYGTPGYQNSQYKLFQNPMLNITITPKIFSPDGDGQDDVATITYTVAESGFVGNVFIYDASGRQVRHLVTNAVLGSAGRFIWNGLDENGQRLPVGRYVIYAEVFNLQGKKQQFKKAIVLASRLN